MKRKFAVDDDDMPEDDIAFAEQLPCVKTPPLPCEQQQSRLLRLPDDLLVEIFSFEDNEREAFFLTLPYVCRRFNHLLHTRLKDVVATGLYREVNESGEFVGGHWHGFRAITVLNRHLARGCYADFVHLTVHEDGEDDGKGKVSNNLLDLIGRFRPIGVHLIGDLPSDRNTWSLGPRLVSFEQRGRFTYEHIGQLVDNSPFLRALVLESRDIGFEFTPEHLFQLEHASYLHTLVFKVEHELNLDCVLALAKSSCTKTLEVLTAGLDASVFCEQGVAALASFVNLHDIYFEVTGTPTTVDLSPLRVWQRMDDVRLKRWPFEMQGSTSFLTETKTPVLKEFCTEHCDDLQDSQLHAILKHNQATLVMCFVWKTPDITEDAFADLLPTKLSHLTVKQRTTTHVGKTWDCLLGYVQHWPALDYLRLDLCADAPMLEIRNLNPRLKTLELACLPNQPSLAQSGLRHLTRLRRLVLGSVGSSGQARTRHPPTCSLSATELIAELASLKSLTDLNLFVLGITPEVIKQVLLLPLISVIELQKETRATAFMQKQATLRGKQIKVYFHSAYTRFVVQK